MGNRVKLEREPRSRGRTQPNFDVSLEAGLSGRNDVVAPMLIDRCLSESCPDIDDYRLQRVSAGRRGTPGAGHWALFAVLLLAVCMALPAWAGDGEDCSWPEPADTLLKTNPERLMSACRRLADQGNVNGQLNLGFMYGTGRGVPKDHAEAVKWWQEAADQGSVRAQANLRLIHEMGLGAPLDPAGAPTWPEKTAERGGTIAESVRNAPDIAPRVEPVGRHDGVGRAGWLDRRRLAGSSVRRPGCPTERREGRHRPPAEMAARTRLAGR